MDKISTIKDRILFFLDSCQIRRAEFFETTGISAGNFKGKNKESQIGGDALVKVLTLYPQLSPAWLLTGSGEMLTDPVSCLSPSSGSVSIPSDVWDVIKKQAFSLEKKDAQMDRCITLLEQSFETLKGAAVHSGVSVAAAGRSDVG